MKRHINADISHPIRDRNAKTERHVVKRPSKRMRASSYYKGFLIGIVGTIILYLIVLDSRRRVV